MTIDAGAIREFETQPLPPSRRLHFMVPILIGLASPLLALLFIDPRALGSVSVILHIYLFFILIIATGAFLISVFDQGDVTKLSFDKANKEIVVERTGLLAKKLVSFPFADVASVKIETRFDDDGYQTMLPVMTLTTRETIPLPAGTGDIEIAAIREILGRKG